ncbi:flagellar biosynthesis protein FlhB [Aliidiomarina taiwanensis]|uniref:Flagellar biosynthetic protein FlhB n=1 Tax=Aliidiomarina taiwanensis TaxID=946228 RepID=A0A432WZ44_9GAMM|nr:flagellar biosynthesis protein FlhB [Aliidiomarina taiwanensis]RUO39035.1 flagellar biosynthesis protein FlhB [Aliidiomarina taiwanensis]
MSDGQEKTEEPTAKKQEQAREKGQVARSKELGTLGVLLSAAIALIITAPQFALGLESIMAMQFELDRNAGFDQMVMFQLWPKVGSALLKPMSIFFGIVVLGAFVGNIMLGGFNFSMQAASPKPSKMSPLKGFKRMFGPQAIVELLKGLGKFFVIAICSYFLLKWQFPKIISLSEGIQPVIFADALKLVGFIFVLMVLSLLLIVAIDVPFQSHKHHKQLKMTKQEVKDERKNSEGNPQVKAKMRSMQMSMVMRRMMQDIPQADVVVTNPTHFAVALKYDPNGRDAPRVVAKGRDEVAARIREIADEAEVPLLSNPPLARSIYYTTELGHEIPEGLFMAVAQVLAYVYQLRAFHSGRGKRPKKPSSELPIPEDLQFDEEVG